MTGAAFALGPCWACGRTFTFAPELVPTFNGEPLCRRCIAEVNARRGGLGLAPFPILAGAYPER